MYIRVYISICITPICTYNLYIYVYMKTRTQSRRHARPHANTLMCTRPPTSLLHSYPPPAASHTRESMTPTHQCIPTHKRTYALTQKTSTQRCIRQFVFAYVFMKACSYEHACTLNMLVYMYLFLHVCMHSCMCVCVHVCIYACICVSKMVFVCAFMLVSRHV